MLSIRLSALTLALALASSAAAYDFSSQEVFLPVVSRVPGANGTQWRTDVVITNRHEHLPVTVSMIFDVAGPAEAFQARIDLDPRQTVTLVDIVGAKFGMQTAYGTLWIGSPNANTRISAHARIYNVGNPAGEFGQMMPAMPIEHLSKVVWLEGLNGVRGNRANVGIANPNNQPASFSLAWFDKDGESHGSVGMITVQPWDVLLINDIFAYTGMPYDESMSLRIRGDVNVYAYGSIVRNDTGDAYTILGSGANTD